MELGELIKNVYSCGCPHSREKPCEYVNTPIKCEECVTIAIREAGYVQLADDQTPPENIYRYHGLTISSTPAEKLESEKYLASEFTLQRIRTPHTLPDGRTVVWKAVIQEGK